MKKVTGSFEDTLERMKGKPIVQTHREILEKREDKTVPSLAGTALGVMKRRLNK